MTPEELQVAEKRAYSRGYAAGKRRLAQTRQRERTEKAETAFWQRAMLAAIPATISASGWSRGEVPIKGLGDRMRLAADAADDALSQAKSRGRL